MELNIRELRKQLNLSQQDLSDKTGIPKGRISAWEIGKGSPKVEDTRVLIDFFERTGIFERKVSQPVKMIPFYDAVAVGGTGISADQSPVYSHSDMIDPGTFLNRATGSLRVYGHSMFPKYPAGSIVAFKEADIDLIAWGEDYVLELSDRRIIKRIEKGDQPDIIQAVSYNKSEEYKYAPMDIPKSKIKRLYMVVGKIEMEASV